MPIFLHHQHYTYEKDTHTRKYTKKKYLDLTNNEVSEPDGCHGNYRVVHGVPVRPPLNGGKNPCWDQRHHEKDQSYQYQRFDQLVYFLVFLYEDFVFQWL